MTGRRQVSNIFRAFLIIGFSLVSLGTAVRIVDPEPLRIIRLAYFDQLQRAAPRKFPELPVRVVDIDDRALAEFGQWPWPRNLVADLTARLLQMGAASVAYDVLFSEPDRYSPARLAQHPAIAVALKDPASLSSLDNDALLAATIEGNPVVLGIASAQEDRGNNLAPKSGLVEIGDAPTRGLYSLPQTTRLAPPLYEAAAGIGGVNVAPGQSTGVVREVPLFWQTPGGVMPGLAVEALRLALGESTYLLTGVPGVPGALESVGLGPFDIPTGPEGQFWVHYRRDDPRLYISAADILSDETGGSAGAAVEGAIVLVGTSSAGLLDIRTTALGETVPGVSIHAQIIEQILSGDALRRTDFTAGLEIIAFIVLGIVMTSLMTQAGAVTTVVSGLFVGASIVAISALSYMRAGILFDATFPLLGGAANFFLLLAYQFIAVDRDKRRIRRSFSHYVAPEVLSDIEKGGHQLELGGITKEVTVLFSDIRGFTPLSEKLSATDLVELLNDLFTNLGAEILRERGTLDKFIGDAVMAFWNAPLEVEDHALHAARAALQMRQSLAAFNARSQAAGRPPIAIAMGFATGIVCVGNIGSRDRFNYTAIGEAVNTAARIEASCRRIGYDIVTTQHSVEMMAGRIATLPAGRLELKGISEREALCIVIGDEKLARSEVFAELREHHTRLIKALVLDDEVPAALDACRHLISQIEPGLAGFYDALRDRRADFL
ncbi:adenylate/guanylate cyclase domain-containing protein [Sinirhodobacter sp. WL0062]|uniref:Adenylate/guanylate cyclase domain-containing protein n=1 Tax=Rhodobacter flavimaris TaxID=2907145 RepID=A0ABS8YT66_9RHOB|nr:adenylate/guanylate cyclase domain-containing protein [Sinirhodobacter sp. WL0062]MCE5973062.1 adenylate/guanylate cyclase domain-containing protein [Sinirhodobacter sp. WL0062]